MKSISVLTSVIIIFSVGFSCFADEKSDSNDSTDPYQLIMDKLNEEYGTNVHYPTMEECELLNITFEKMTGPLDEFERNLRKDIDADLAATAEAKELARKGSSSEVEGIESGSCSDSKEVLRSSQTVTRNKNVPGATVYLKATVSDYGNYWHYSSVQNVWATWTAGYNSTPMFFLESYTYSFRDSRRTCFVELYGCTMNSEMIVINSNAYRSVEFYASSGM